MCIRDRSKAAGCLTLSKLSQLVWVYTERCSSRNLELSRFSLQFLAYVPAPTLFLVISRLTISSRPSNQLLARQVGLLLQPSRNTGPAKPKTRPGGRRTIHTMLLMYSYLTLCIIQREGVGSKSGCIATRGVAGVGVIRCGTHDVTHIIQKSFVLRGCTPIPRLNHVTCYVSE